MPNTWGTQSVSSDVRIGMGRSVVVGCMCAQCTHVPLLSCSTNMGVKLLHTAVHPKKCNPICLEHTATTKEAKTPF